MIFKGTIKDISRDWKTNKPLITLVITEGLLDGINDLIGKDLFIEIKNFFKKRSINANSYLWVLCEKLAVLSKTSKDEIYEIMIQRYGFFYTDDDGNPITLTVSESTDMSKIIGHWKFSNFAKDGITYFMMKGSSKYNASEMNYFLDMIINEAKEQGIQTDTPKQIERLKALWEEQRLWEK